MSGLIVIVAVRYARGNYNDSVYTVMMCVAFQKNSTLKAVFKRFRVNGMPKPQNKQTAETAVVCK